MSYETQEYKGYQIEIDTDEGASNPRTEYENLGTMYCFHSRYKLGDEHKLSIEEVQEIANSDDYISLSLYLYDHSGITMNTSGFSCQWDSGQVGIITISKEKVRKEYGWKRITKARKEQIIKYLKGEVETYDHFIRGDVFCYQIKKDGEEIGGMDSCCGFLGTDFGNNGLLEYAHNAIDCDINHKEKYEGIQQELQLV